MSAPAQMKDLNHADPGYTLPLTLILGSKFIDQQTFKAEMSPFPPDNS